MKVSTLICFHAMIKVIDKVSHKLPTCEFYHGVASKLTWTAHYSIHFLTVHHARKASSTFEGNQDKGACCHGKYHMSKAFFRYTLGVYLLYPLPVGHLGGLWWNGETSWQGNNCYRNLTTALANEFWTVINPWTGIMTYSSSLLYGNRMLIITQSM